MLNYIRLGLTLAYLFYPFVIPSIIWNLITGKKHLTHINWSRDVCKFFNLRINKIG